MNEKILFRGTFNWHSEVLTLYAHAATKRQAWTYLCGQIAKKVGITASKVRLYFSGREDNYRIEREVEK